MRLEGTGFRDVPVVRLGARDRAALRGAYRVQLERASQPPKQMQDVVSESETQLQFTVPAGLPAAKYDVVVLSPAGHRLVLANAYTVTNGAEPGDPPRLSLETKPDGTGVPVSERTLSLGEAIDLYTVLRNWKGDVDELNVVATFSQEDVLGELSGAHGTHAQFVARLPGQTTVRAVADEDGKTASAALQIEGDLSEFSLSLETASHGEGETFPPRIAMRLGETLYVHAVARNASQEFVLDVPAQWEVTGEQSGTARGERLSLPLESLGITGIAAQYLSLTASMEVEMLPGRALKLALDPPSSVELRAGDAAQAFVVKGVDARGNETDDVGELSWSIVDGTFGDFERSGGRLATLTPRRAGAGYLHIESSYGLALTSGRIAVLPGPLKRLSLSPDTLMLSADDDPVQFQVTGFDAFDNQTSELGTLTWVTNGELTTLGVQGELDPVQAGTGSITVTSSLGPAATSGSIEIIPGELVTISIQPQTWSGKVSDPAQQFSAVGSDSDGNAITDIGTLSFRIASGPIAAIDAQTGLFTPTIAGQGTIEVTSSYGFQDVSQNIVVSPLEATLRISAIRAPSFFWDGQRGARVEVDITSTDADEVPISGVGLSFSSLTGDRSSYFSVVPDRANSDRVPAGGTRTLVYHVDVDPALSALTALTVSATGEAFPTIGAPFLFAGSVLSSSRNSLTEPQLWLTAPAPPANRLCAGGQVSFAAETDTALSSSYEWRIPGGNFVGGSSASSRTPTASFSTVGNHVYSVTATYFGFSNTLLGAPIYVGTVAALAADTYPAGPVVFSGPSAGQNVGLGSFPRSNLLAIAPGTPVRQCNNSAIDPAGHTALTVFSDRGLIDPSADVDPLTPGIQLQLTAAGLLGSVPLVAPSAYLEGESTVYAEYFDASSGTVTAAGDRTFWLTGDTQAPAVQWTIPAADCGSACLAPGDTLVFQFNEPMLSSSLNNTRVEVFQGTTCAGQGNNVTGAATRSYEPAARALYVKPGSRNGSYAIRVQLPATITDAASARNALPAMSRCVIFEALGAASAAAVPQLAAAALAAFSPDGDGIDDSVTFKVNADAATSFLRMRVTRAGKTVWARLLPVTGAGEYSIVWDGSDESGRIVPDGVYGYGIEAVNRSGVASSALRGYVEVDSAVRFVSVRRQQ